MAAALRLAIVIGVAIVTGCAGGEDLNPATLVCPTIGILPDLDQMTVYQKEDSRDTSEILHEVRLEQISGECLFAPDQVEVDMTARFDVALGPADTKGTVDIPFFVAVLDPEDRVLSRETYESTLVFEDGHRRLFWSENLQQVIAYEKGWYGTDYRVVFGLALTRKQLEDNRRGVHGLLNSRQRRLF